MGNYEALGGELVPLSPWCTTWRWSRVSYFCVYIYLPDIDNATGAVASVCIVIAI